MTYVLTVLLKLRISHIHVINLMLFTSISLRVCPSNACGARADSDVRLRVIPVTKRMISYFNLVPERSTTNRALCHRQSWNLEGKFLVTVSEPILIYGSPFYPCKRAGSNAIQKQTYLPFLLCIYNNEPRTYLNV